MLDSSSTQRDLRLELVKKTYLQWHQVLETVSLRLILVQPMLGNLSALINLGLIQSSLIYLNPSRIFKRGFRAWILILKLVWMSSLAVPIPGWTVSGLGRPCRTYVKPWCHLASLFKELILCVILPRILYKSLLSATWRLYRDQTSMYQGWIILILRGNKW